MPESTEPNMTAEQLLRQIHKRLGLPDLVPIAAKFLYRTHTLDERERTVIYFEEMLYVGEEYLAWQSLAWFAKQTDADLETWQLLSQAAKRIRGDQRYSLLDERADEMLRRGLKREMPEPSDRRFPHLNFEQLLRHALREMELPDVRFIRGNETPDDPREAIAWKFEDHYDLCRNRSAWAVLATYAVDTDANTVARSYLVEAEKFLNLADEPSEQFYLLSTIHHTLLHQPYRLDVEIDDEGWIALSSILLSLRRYRAEWQNLSHDDLMMVLSENRIEQFSFELHDGNIRARYRPWVPVEPPQTLFCGAAPDTVTSILSEGLKPQKDRNHVTLYTEEMKDRRFPRWHWHNTVIMTIHADEAYRNEVVFRQATEHIFLADVIPPQFIEALE